MTARKRKRTDFDRCVDAGFDEVGTKNLEPRSKIVWAAYSEEDVRAIGGAIEECLNAKGRMCPPLGGAFVLLREEKRVTPVSELVAALADICG